MTMSGDDYRAIHEQYRLTKSALEELESKMLDRLDYVCREFVRYRDINLSNRAIRKFWPANEDGIITVMYVMVGMTSNLVTHDITVEIPQAIVFNDEELNALIDSNRAKREKSMRDIKERNKRQRIEILKRTADELGFDLVPRKE